MKRIVFLFPGVGSQHVGMGKALYDDFNIFRETLEEAGDVLGMDMAELCFSPAKKKELDRLENAQLALVAVSVATFRVYMQESGVKPRYCMGHSLGEYSALCCAGVIRFPDTLMLVKERGSVVNQVAAAVNGTMAWVINLDSKVVEGVCRDAFKKGREVHVSAFDSPHQTSISGVTEALMSVARELENKGAIVYPLRLSGPFHSPIMKEAAERMAAILGLYKYENPRCSVIANRDALPYKDARSVVENLALQLMQPIQWRESVNYILEQGVDIGIEIGSRKVLKFLVEKNTPSVRAFALDNHRDLAAIAKELVVTDNISRREEIIL
ncbi:MAG: ACP S-malonyltransferase [bacterium]|nr:ACP S-malonyltransferase [bacterium]